MSPQKPTASIDLINFEQITCHGFWTLDTLGELARGWEKTTWPRAKQVTINGRGINAMDTAGAWLLQRIWHHLHTLGKQVEFADFAPEQQAILELAKTHADKVLAPAHKIPAPNMCYRIGFEAHRKLKDFAGFLTLIGELAIMFLRACVQPKRFRLASIANTIHETGYGALPIIALLSFLIGVVLTYQFGLELELYGANVYIVNVTGMAILREFAPLVTAIILAGRTSSAFTAQIGMMKVNEEIDALKTMGLSPIERLIMPKLFGTVISMPLLTLWSAGFGVFGAMVMSQMMLEINFYDFLERFQQVISINHYLIGIGKAPAFALIIAAVGCYQGMQVSGSALSVGQQTTRAVVQAIFIIIVADAGFSIAFSMLGI